MQSSLVGGDKLKLLKKMPEKIEQYQPTDIADTVKKLLEVSAAKCFNKHSYCNFRILINFMQL